MTFRPELRAKISVRAITSVVSEATGVSLTQMRALRREPRICQARHMISGLSKALTERSFLEIGAVMSRDHTAIMHGVDRCKALLAEGGAFAETYAACRDVLIALAEKDLVRLAEGIDAVDVARRILSQGDRGAHGASIVEIRAMAEYIAEAAREAHAVNDQLNDVSKTLFGDDCHV